MTQIIIVYIIGALVAVYIAWKIVGMFRGRGHNPCTGCSGCDLKEQFKKKQDECRAEQHTGQKKNSRPQGGCGCGCR